MSSALNIGLSTGNVGIGNQSYNNQLIPASNGRINGVNITALNERTRASRASAEACVSSWVSRITSDAGWRSVCWAPELSLFVAVADFGVDGFVMTSSDAVSWITRSVPVNNNWNAVCWSPELSLFVTVGWAGTGNRIMTSSNGINWVTRTSPADNNWFAVTWASELSLFVSTAWSGVGNRVMTSSNGINWVTRSSPADYAWISICWSSELSLFVAGGEGSGAVMISNNGINWVTSSSSTTNSLKSICWSSELSLFVGVCGSGTGNRVITSSNGINWTTRSTPADNQWWSVCWSPELSIFVSVSQTGTGNRIMTSNDGVIWATKSFSIDNTWSSVCWSPELSIFVSVAVLGGQYNKSMTSAIGMPNSKSVVKALPSQMMVSADGNVGIGTTVPLAKLHVQGYIKNEQAAFSYSKDNGNPGVGVILYNFKNYDRNNNYSTSTGRFTVPVTGCYYFTYHYITSTSPTNLAMYKNGTPIGGTYTENNTNAVGYTNPSASIVLSLIVNDYIEIRVVAGTMYGFNYNQFSGFYLG